MTRPRVGIGSVVGDNVRPGLGLTVGHYTVIGADGPVHVGRRVRVGSYSIVEAGASLGDDVIIDSYCRVEGTAVIGTCSQILYGAQLFERVRVGARCVVGGSIMDDAVLEDDVTFMGQMAHSYRQPGTIASWDGPPQRSITIGTKTVVGERALLVGGIDVGARSYIAAGEVVRCDVPSDTLVMRGEFFPMRKFRGLIRART